MEYLLLYTNPARSSRIPAYLLPLLSEEDLLPLPHCFPAFLFHGVLHFFLFQCPPVYEPAEIVCFLCRPDSGDESLYHIQMQLLQK